MDNKTMDYIKECFLEIWTRKWSASFSGNESDPGDFGKAMKVINVLEKEATKEIPVYKVSIGGVSYVTDSFKDLVSHLSVELENNDEAFPTITSESMPYFEYKTLGEFQGY